VADRVVLGSQFRRQRAGALAGPAQGRLRVAARRRLDQTVQGGRQAGIVGRQRVSPAAFMANPVSVPVENWLFRNFDASA